MIALGDLEVDLRRREARRSGEVVALTTREFDLLAFLANNVGPRALAPAAPRRRLGQRLVRRRADGRRPRGPAAQEARIRSPPGHRLGRRLPVRLSDAPPPHAGHGRPGRGGARHRRGGQPDPHPQRGAQPGAAAAGLGGRIADVVQGRPRSVSTSWPPSRKTLKLEDADLIQITALGNVVTPLPDGSHRAGHRRGGAAVGADQLGPQGQPRLRRGAGHALAGGTGDSPRRPAPALPSGARWPSS